MSRRWALMGAMHQQGWQLHRLLDAEKIDEAAARKAYDAMAGLRKQMFEAKLEAHKKIDALLTKQQREELKRGWGGRWGHR